MIRIPAVIYIPAYLLDRDPVCTIDCYRFSLMAELSPSLNLCPHSSTDSLSWRLLSTEHIHPQSDCRCSSTWTWDLHRRGIKDIDKRNLWDMREWALWLRDYIQIHYNIWILPSVFFSVMSKYLIKIAVTCSTGRSFFCLN